MQKLPVAYQLYSAREMAAQDPESVLRAIAALGYDGVEFAGFYGKPAAEIKALLEAYHLAPVSSHVPFATIEADMDAVIEQHLAVGCPYIAVPYLDEATRPGAAGFARALCVMYAFGERCRDAGITLLYHNHDFEFERLSGQYALDFLYDAIPETHLQTELDVCWIKYAGLDPVDYLRKYAGRCPVVHLKDYEGRKGSASPYGLLGQGEQVERAQAFEFRPFGFGCQDVPAVLNAAVDSGARWLVVEQDQPWRGTPLENAAQSMETLKRAGIR